MDSAKTIYLFIWSVIPSNEFNVRTNRRMDGNIYSNS